MRGVVAWVDRSAVIVYSVRVNVLCGGLRIVLRQAKGGKNLSYLPGMGTPVSIGTVDDGKRRD